MAVGLDTFVSVGGLADARVPELLLDPPQIRAVAQEPGRSRRAANGAGLAFTHRSSRSLQG